MNGKTIVAILVAIVFMIVAYHYPAEIFILFILSWLFIVPLAFVVLLVLWLAQ